MFGRALLLGILFSVILLGFSFSQNAYADTENITLRSDSSNTFLAVDDPGKPFANEFTPADFAAARSGLNAYEITHHSAWNAHLTVDPTGTYIGVFNANPNIPPDSGNLISALYAVDFEIASGSIDSATLDIHFLVDNNLGWIASQGHGGATNEGVFINGQPVVGTTLPSSVGGFGPVDNSFTSLDISGLVNSGTNTLYVYASDYGQPSGLQYLADITVEIISEPVNTASTVDAGPDTTIDEGDLFSYTGSFTDPDADSWTATVDYGDGTGVQPLTLNLDKTFALGHTYTQDVVFANSGNSFEVVVTVYDDSGDTSDNTSDIVFVTVDNVAPIIDPIIDETIAQGDMFSTVGSFVDPGNDPFEGTVLWGDGTGVAEVLSINPDNTFSLDHVYAQDGTYDVVIIIDDLGDFTADEFTFEVIVTNEVSSIFATPDSVLLNEGDTLTGSGYFTDSDDDLWNVSIDYGDGTEVTSLFYDAAKTFEFAHLYDVNDTFEVVVTVDDGTDLTSTVFLITVDNVAPTVHVIDATITEGDLYQTTGSFEDPGDDTWSATIDYGDGSGVQPLTLNPDMSFDLVHTFSDNGSNVVTVTIYDGDDDSTGTATITVDNTAPIITVENQVVDLTRTFLATGSFEDPGDDTWSATIDYGDGSGVQPLLLNPDNTFSLNHNYGMNGAFTVTVEVIDDDGDVGILSFTIGVFVSDDESESGVNPPIPVTTTLDHTATFTTTNQDIWGPVTGGTGTSSSELFTPQNWNQQTPKKGDFTTLLGDSYGASIDAGTQGHLKLTSVAEDLEGQTSVNYSGDIELEYLDHNSFLAGTAVPIDSTWILNTGNTVINAGQTTGDLALNLDLKVDAFVDTRVCFVDCFDPFDIDDVGFDLHPFTLFNFDSAGSTTIPPAVLSALGTGATFSPISVQPTTTSVDSLTGTVVATDTNAFSNMYIDIDKVATNLGVAPPLGKTIPTPSATVSYDIFAADSDIDFKAHQKLTFDTTVLVKLDFSSPVSGVTGSFISAEVDGDGKITSVIYRLGDEIQVIFPEGQTDPITVTPTALLDSDNTTLHNFAKLITTSDVTMKSGEASISAGGFTILESFRGVPWTEYHNWECHGFLCTSGHYHTKHTHYYGGYDGVSFDGVNLSLGPLWTSGPQGVQNTEQLLANKGFPLGGFNDVPLASFLLDPEVPPTADIGGPYVVDEGSIILLDGVDSFDVDLPPQPLDYSWDLDNDAIFEIHPNSDTFVNFVDGIDGPATHPISLEVCDYLNCNIDSGMVDVLNVAPTVDAGVDTTVDEGSLYAASGSFVDPGADTWTATVDYGDGTGIAPLTLNADKTFDLSHTFADNGIYTVTVVVTDDDHDAVFKGETVDGQGSSTLAVTVNNVSPSVEAGIDQEVVIHDLVNLDPATYSDPGFDCSECATLEDFTAIVNWGEFDDESLIVTEIPGSVGVLTEGTASGSHIYRLPGEYTVTVTVDDDDTGSTSDTLVTTVLGAQDLKNRVLSTLEPFELESKDVKDAIKKIEKSLDVKLWEDEVNLDNKKGKKVFSEEKSAVKKLLKIVKPEKNDNDDDDKKKKKSASPELKAAAQFGIDTLVNADRVLAITAMLEATSTPVENSKDQKKVDKENEKSSKEFVKADGYRDEGKSDKAIDHYKKAWEHAMHAIKHAQGNHDSDDDDD